MSTTTKKIIVLGTSHYNTIGMVQCLGYEGLYVIAVVVGESGLLSKSVFVKEIHEVKDYQSAISFILHNLTDSLPQVIIPCGDEAALQLEKNKERLKGRFLCQYVSPPNSLAVSMNKHYQVGVAKECGIAVPESYEISSLEQIHDRMALPCIIKPLVSCEGDKRDICIANSIEELKQNVERLLSHTPRVIIQQYIQNKDKELNLIGCAFHDGSCIIPLSIEKIRIHPQGTGSVSVGRVTPIDKELNKLIPKMEEMINRIGYVGLFSFEFILDNSSNAAYFIELNLRNDALNPFVVKGGVNLPYLHFLDLTGLPLKHYSPIKKSKKMICEPIHSSSLYHKGISPFAWVKDIITASSFMLFYKKDWKLFFLQFCRFPHKKRQQ